MTDLPTTAAGQRAAARREAGGVIDVLVVGAGPGGLAAARAARQSGAGVVLLDAADQVGGQFWRHPAAGQSGPVDKRFAALWQALADDPGCEIVTGAQVWSVARRDDAPPVVHVLVGAADGAGRAARVLTARALVLATGAHERTLPFPGWDIPGVFTAGAAQAMAKGERVAVGRRVLVAGAGPFLLPVATSLLRLGARVVGVVEAGRWARLARGWSARPGLLHGKGLELFGYVRELARHRVPYWAGSAVVAAHGAERVAAVTVARLSPEWTPLPGTERRISVDAVCVSHGFVPRTEMGLASGCAAGPDGALLVDAAQRTTVRGVFAAGEVTGIGGADLALAEGVVAGRGAAGGVASGAELRRLAARRGFAARLEAAHGIRPGWAGWVTDDTIVCRCEEVTAGELRAALVATGTRGLRSLKLTSRAGLGSCQGRMCGRSVEDLMRRAVPGGPLDPGRTAVRPIVVPVRLGEIAGFLPPIER